MINQQDTIIAPSTPPGVSAIAVIRLSGIDAIQIMNGVFRGKDLTKAKTHTLHFGVIADGSRVIDEVVVALFKSPRSFTLEDSIEISTHGSPYVVREVINLLVRQGARLAGPGEFTRRAFLNGRFDLAQAEAVADLIHSDSEAAHQAAISQMRGGFSKDIGELREKLLHFASLIELELDFSEEDVEFANRQGLSDLINQLLAVINPLIDSFARGNAIKNGVPVVIVGKPNAGKSTLLNALLNEEKAIVSEIAGTTRDVIEDQINIEGVIFRFIDTAGLRETTDAIEAQGVARAHEQMSKAALIIYLFDLAEETPESIKNSLSALKKHQIPLLPIGNKKDKAAPDITAVLEGEEGYLLISAKQKEHLDQLRHKLLESVHLDQLHSGDPIITNARHYETLTKAREALAAVDTGLESGLTEDLLAEDIRRAINYLGEITGEITNDEVLGSIFSKFCIGK